MADELNTPTHRWYQRRYNIALSPNEVSPKWILAAGIAKINAWIASLAGYAVNGFDPALVFDFVGSYYRTSGTETTFSSAMTHTRASSATMMNASGTLVTVGNNVPRTGHHIYNGSAWVNEGILHESEARTNLLPTSSVLGYSKIGTATSTSTVVSPSGLQDAVLVRPIVASGVTWVYDLTIYNTGVVTTISTFAKASGKSFLTTADSNGTSMYASFNLTTGAVGTVASGYTANMEDFGNGWYRCSVTTPTGFSERAIYAVSDTDNAVAAAANGNDGILLYGAQLEAGATPSSYIPTTSVSVTRAAETLTVPAANLPYDSTNMSIQMDGKMTYADTDGDNGKFFRWHLDNSNNIYSMLSTYQSRTGAIYWVQESGNVLDAVTGPATSYSPDTNVPFNFASRHGSTFLNGAIDGTALTANTTPTALPDLSSTDLNLGYKFMGTIGQFRMWSDDLGDTGIAEAST